MMTRPINPFLVLGASLVLTCSTHAGDAEVSLEKILTIWKKRYVPFRATWSTRSHWRKGGLRGVEPLKNQDRHSSMTVRLSLGRTRVRIKHEGTNMFPGVKVNKTQVYDGSTLKELFSRHGVIGSEPQYDRLFGYPASQAFMHAMRTFQPTHPFFPLGEFELLDETEIVNGTECVALHWRTQRDGSECWLWLDPTKDYSIVRHISKYDNGMLRSMTDISYREHDIIGWSPSEWRIHRFMETGKTKVTETTKLTSLELVPAFDDGEFRLEYPRGMTVTVFGDDYVQGEDGLTLAK